MLANTVLTLTDRASKEEEEMENLTTLIKKSSSKYEETFSSLQ